MSFVIYGKPYRGISVHLILSFPVGHPRRQQVLDYIEAAAEIITAKYETTDDGTCAICGEMRPADQTHSSSNGCDSCIEQGLALCDCCHFAHDLWYLWEAHGLDEFVTLP